MSTFLQASPLDCSISRSGSICCCHSQCNGPCTVPGNGNCSIELLTYGFLPSLPTFLPNTSPTPSSVFTKHSQHILILAETWFFSGNTTSLRRPHSLHPAGPKRQWGILLAPHTGIHTPTWYPRANAGVSLRFTGSGAPPDRCLPLCSSHSSSAIITDNFGVQAHPQVFLASASPITTHLLVLPSGILNPTVHVWPNLPIPLGLPLSYFASCFFFPLNSLITMLTA